MNAFLPSATGPSSAGAVARGTTDRSRSREGDAGRMGRGVLSRSSPMACPTIVSKRCSARLSVPYLGVVIGLLLATLAAFTQFSQFSDILIVWVIFGIGQLLEGMLVTPWLVGQRIGLHPLVVIFALLAFGQLFGFFGLLLALPLSAALLVGLRHLRRWYLSSALYS